ncbi:MAG: protein translocase subunit SecD [Chloroflexi bacterium]|nr:protein translocase subunit SecD [Chloroflexota bacterium]
MQQRNLTVLISIIILAAISIWIDMPSNPGLHLTVGPLKIDREIKVYQGLDLQGGLQVMLEADVPSTETLDPDAMLAARGIIEQRINGLGVSEPLIQAQGDKRILVELPGLRDPDQAIKTFGETGLLEFVDAGDTFLPRDTVVRTTSGGSEASAITDTTALTGTAPLTVTTPLTVTGPLSDTSPPAVASTRVFTTVMTGKHLKSASVSFDNLGKPQISFELTGEGAKIFADYTRSHVGKILAIVLDKKVISAPRIQSPILEGRGVITGKFNLEEARSMVIQLKYGALPVPLRVIEIRTVGPTLGQDSVKKSMTAGLIGIIIVILFMALNYRLPGLLADVALTIYALVVLALFKLIPVTLTLAGIAGFILSVGMAVDANILIFERMKEELRWGRPLNNAVEEGFRRAWPSIRDSNFSTLITCTILFWFGSMFGASIVKGFALTLALGVVISMFTAIVVTHTFLRLIMGIDLTKNHWWFGV